MITDNQIISRDLKCYQKMINTLTSYQKGEINLNSLISDIKGLTNLLEIASDEWKEELRTNYNTFEVARAMALSRVPPELNDHDKSIILEDVEQLKLLIEKKIEEYN